MAIDISTEHPLPFTQAAAHLPRRRRGRKAAVSTLYRWASAGVRGIRLETLQVGGTLCTSVQALQRFFDRLTARTQGQDHSADSSGAKQRRLERVDQQLDALWK
jgi:hypothetical protein